MLTFSLTSPDDFDGWRSGAKHALAQGLSSADVIFQVDGEADDLFGGPPVPTTAQPVAANTQPRVPKAYIDLARHVACHTDSERFALLYRLLLRLQHERNLMGQSSDPDIWRAQRMAKEIRRDAHKMMAFVRFR